MRLLACTLGETACYASRNGTTLGWLLGLRHKMSSSLIFLTLMQLLYATAACLSSQWALRAKREASSHVRHSNMDVEAKIISLSQDFCVDTLQWCWRPWALWGPWLVSWWALTSSVIIKEDAARLRFSSTVRENMLRHTRTRRSLKRYFFQCVLCLCQHLYAPQSPHAWKKKQKPQNMNENVTMVVL